MKSAACWGFCCLRCSAWCSMWAVGCSQMGGSMVFFAQNFVDRRVLGWEVPPTVFLSVFALFVVALALPVAAVWRRLENRGAPQSAPTKIAISIAFIAASFLLLSVAARGLAPDGSQGASAGVLLSFYVLQAAAVAILGPVGLVDGYSLDARWLGGAAHGRVVRFDRTGGPARRVRRVRQFPCAEH